MSLRWVHLLAGVLILALVTAGCDSDSGMDDPPPPTEDPTTIADIVADDGNFSTLLNLLQDEGLTDALGDEDATFTVFAPTDAAFGPYDLDAIAGTEGAMGSILRYHVVEGAAVAAGDLTDGQTIETLAGDEVTVSIQDGNVFIDGSQVTQADVEADNGIVHVIDRTLIGNQNLANVAAFVNETSALFDAVAGAGLGEAVAGAENWTVFGPNNSAFESADLSGFTESEIQAILQYHVFANDTVDSASLLALLGDEGGETTLETLQGEDLTVALDGEQVVFNDGQATLDVDNLDYFASNGILHVIDGLLVPPSMGEMPEPTIAGIVADNDDFSTLLAAVDAAGLTGALDDESASLTVFAPNNDAFGPINTDNLLADNAALTDVLQYHVIDQEIFASDLSEGENTVTTLAGEELTVTVDGSDIFIEGSQVIQTDIEASNGVIHAIDRTLLGNQNLANVVQFAAETEELFGTVGNAGLADAFVGADDWTLFGPNNATFEGADLSGFTESEIEEILKYHVFPDDITSSDDLLQLLSDNGGTVTITTLQGEDLTITQKDASTIVFNDGENGPQATLDLNNLDYFGSNGILHVIDGLLVPPSLSASTIAGIVADNDDFSTLLAAVDAAGLTGALDDESASLTVFAPNNDAFGPINTDNLLADNAALTDVLQYHVIDQEIFASDLGEGDNTVTTLAGEELTVTVDGSDIFIEGSQVIQTDIEAGNGVIHVLDRTLLGNQNLANVVQFTAETEALFGAVADFGLADAFVGADDWTLFGPNNDTFANADLSGFTESEIQAILQYHVFPDAITSSGDLLQLLSDNGGTVTIPTLQGEDLTITQDGEEIVFNDGQATLDLGNLDYVGSNGILHVIDGLLVPPSFGKSTIAGIVADGDSFTTLDAALGATGLDATLDDRDATFTVFAPADASFAPYDVDFLVNNPMLLEEVLGFHVVQGAAVFAGDLSDGDTFTTVQGDAVEIAIEGGDIFVEGAKVTTADVEAANGVVHVVDDVLLTNRTAGERLLITNATEALYGAIESVGLVGAFNDPNNTWTTFAPDNAAFDAADLSGFSDSEIQAILQYHTLDGITDAAALLQLLADNGGTVSVPTNQGEDLTITQKGASTIVFNDDPDEGPQATLDLDSVDQRASNGIIHLIDGILLPPSLSASTIAGIVEDGDSFTTLDAALGATGLDATLDDRDATFTVFAPADASFAPYDVDFLVNNPMLLEEVLGFHVVQGAAAFAGDLSDGDTFTTVQGDEVEIAIEGGDIFVEGAQVTTADVEAANGVVHVVDDVLLTNRTAVERATVTSAFSILADLVGEAGLADALSGPGPDGEDGITVFAPTNDALLAALDANGNGTIDDDEIPSNAADILQYHVLDDVFFAADVPTTETALPTLQGADVTVVRSGSDVSINPDDENASVIAPDVEASNGVIHGIDTVLVIPPSH